MLAAIYKHGGDSRVLSVADVPTPEPGPGEVRVRVALSGVNPTDWKSLETAEPPATGFAVPNRDGAGVIDAVGPGVDPGRVGARVWLLQPLRERQWGTAAQFTVVPSEHAVLLPETASDELGASLGIPALTAWYALMADGEICDRTVLVSGGAGAVGHMAVQLAAHAGARVIATVSNAEKAELARAAGAHTVVNYREPGAAEQIRAAAPAGVDRIVEVDLTANLDLDLAVVANNAVISSYAATPESIAQVPVRALMTDNVVLRFLLLYTLRTRDLAAAVHGVSSAVEAGALTTLPLHLFPLSEVSAAHDAVRNSAVGKVLIEIP